MTVNRRDFIKAAGALSLSSGLMLPFRYLSAATAPISDHKLVVIFLTGGNDAVNAFVPYNEANYYEKRPTLGIPASKLLMPKSVNKNFDFGFNPALSGLKSIYDQGDMALFPATHSGSLSNRSHFFQFDYLNLGRHTSNTSSIAAVRGGWINNYLLEKYKSSNGIEGFDFASNLKALNGGFPHLKLSNPGSISLGGNGAISGQSRDLLKQFRQSRTSSGIEKLISDSQAILANNLDTLKAINFEDVQNGASYPKSGLARKLKQSAALFRSVPELKVTFLTHGSFDTHSNQAATQAKRLQDLGDSIKAYYDDLGAERNNVTLLVMSEFGRTALENGSMEPIMVLQRLILWWVGHRLKVELKATGLAIQMKI